MLSLCLERARDRVSSQGRAGGVNQMGILRRFFQKDTFNRRRGAWAGYIAGVAVPLMLAGLMVVSFRGYGITEDAPVPPQIYTSF